VGGNFVDSSKTNEDIDDLRQHGTNGVSHHAYVPADEPDEKPIKTSDDEQNKGDHVQHFVVHTLGK
jgi:hypothetical protein